MAASYPYIISNNKIEPILNRIRTAAKPDRFTQQFLKKMGFTASNDRAMVTVMRELGFVGDNSAPTEYYDRLRDPTQWKTVLGERIKDLYSDLYAINTNIHNGSDEEIKGALSRVTGKDDKTVARYFTTFKALATLANFSSQPPIKTPEAIPPVDVTMPPVHSDGRAASERPRQTAFHYNIQIHLPATTDISVYNAIFRSMRENLLL